MFSAASSSVLCPGVNVLASEIDVASAWRPCFQASSFRANELRKRPRVFDASFLDSLALFSREKSTNVGAPGRRTRAMTARLTTSFRPVSSKRSRTPGHGSRKRGEAESCRQPRPSTETVDHRLTAGDLHAPPFFIFILSVQLTQTLFAAHSASSACTESFVGRLCFTPLDFFARSLPRGNRRFP